MTWVKICGMTNLEDALVAVEAGADAVGVVFYEKSPRNVSVETAREIVRDMHEGISIPEGLLNTFVLDSGDLQMPGGTGKTFDWERAVPIAEALRQGGAKLVVAGVEARPGKKDPEKVRAFLRAVRAAD